MCTKLYPQIVSECDEEWLCAIATTVLLYLPLNLNVNARRGVTLSFIALEVQRFLLKHIQRSPSINIPSSTRCFTFDWSMRYAKVDVFSSHLQTPVRIQPLKSYAKRYSQARNRLFHIRKPFLKCPKHAGKLSAPLSQIPSMCHKQRIRPH